MNEVATVVVMVMVMVQLEVELWWLMRQLKNVVGVEVVGGGGVVVVVVVWGSRKSSRGRRILMEKEATRRGAGAWGEFGGEWAVGGKW